MKRYAKLYLQALHCYMRVGFAVIVGDAEV